MEEKLDDIMVKIYARRIDHKETTIDKVPDKIKDEVKKLLNLAV